MCPFIVARWAFSHTVPRFESHSLSFQHWQIEDGQVSVTVRRSLWFVTLPNAFQRGDEHPSPRSFEKVYLLHVFFSLFFDGGTCEKDLIQIGVVFSVIFKALND